MFFCLVQSCLNTCLDTSDPTAKTLLKIIQGSFRCWIYRQGEMIGKVEVSDRTGYICFFFDVVTAPEDWIEPSLVNMSVQLQLQVLEFLVDSNSY